MIHIKPSYSTKTPALDPVQEMLQKSKPGFQPAGTAKPRTHIKHGLFSRSKINAVKPITTNTKPANSAQANNSHTTKNLSKSVTQKSGIEDKNHQQSVKERMACSHIEILNQDDFENANRSKIQQQESAYFSEHSSLPARQTCLPAKEPVHTPGFYEKYVKRPQDFLCASAALIALSPVMSVTAILVRGNLGSPVIFKQERPGKDGKVFTLYKFRSMKDARDANGNLLSDEERMTSFGQKLRAASLDELPELINIIKGDMAVVGPRPLLVEYLPLYNEHQARRHEVRPGFTGYAQVHGRNAISWEDKFDKDVWYVDHLSFLEDWKIILETISTVFKKEGISSATSVTMEPFHGTDQKA